MRPFRFAVVLALAFAGTVLCTLEAHADDIGVTPVELRERDDGTTVLLVRAPARLARYFAPPRLRDGTTFEAEGFVPTRGGGGALRFRLADRPLSSSDVIHLPWSRQGVLLVGTLRDGTTARHVFLREGAGIDIPISALRPARTSAWASARDAVWDGVEHFTGSFLHLAFLFALCLSAVGRRGLRYVTWFFGGQLVAVVAGTLASASLPEPVGELGLALATAFVGAGALRRRRAPAFVLVLFLAGVGHGNVLAGSLGSRLGQALGQDAVLLAGVGLTALLVRSSWRGRRTRTGVAALLGFASLLLVLLWIVDSPRAQTLDVNLVEPGSGPIEPLPGGTGAEAGAVAAPSAAVAPPQTSAPLQTFVVIEPYEVRHEILARLRDLGPWIDGLVGASEIPVASQDALKARIASLFRDREAMRIDGRAVQPTLDRVDFVTVGAKGTLLRTEPVPEPVADAYVGVVFTFATGPIAREVSLAWSLFDPVTTVVPAAITDPEQTRTLRLTPAEPTLAWTNDLAHDPVPRVEAVLVEPLAVPIPLVALPLFVLALLLLWQTARDPRRVWRLAAARLTLALAVLAAPLAEASVPVPFVDHPTPSESDAGKTVGQLLTNVYRAFVFRDEEAIYDRLAISVAGDQLSDIYLESRKALEIAERGGARARVEAVQVRSARDIRSDGDGFEATCEWTVAGSVSHFGHRHYRQNRYRARVMVHVHGGAWRLVAIEILEQEREL